MFTHNYVHDNNNANVPGSGTAELGPPGGGLVISGGRTDTVINNRFTRQRQLGRARCSLPRHSARHPRSRTARAASTTILGLGCFYGPWANEIANNTFKDNGGFGNPTNGDLADLSDLHDPGNCFHGNVDLAGITSAPAAIQTTHGVCGVPNSGEAVLGSPLSDQVLCATELLGPCDPSVGHYPREFQRRAARTHAAADDARPVRERSGQRVVSGWAARRQRQRQRERPRTVRIRTRGRRPRTRFTRRVGARPTSSRTTSDR